MPPKISVIIPCYNLANYIDACLESIVAQVVDKVEYIFVNDGSVDDTLSKLKEFVLEKPYCKLINQANAGVSAARNAALDVCTGEYIYLLDGDDILTSESLSMMLNDISDDLADAIISKVECIKKGEIVVLPGSIPVGTYSPTELYKSCKFFDPAPQLIYRRSIIEKYGLRFNSKIYLGEVYDFTIRFLAHAKIIKVVENVYFRYVKRPSSATHTPVYDRDLSIIETIREYVKNAGDLRNTESFILTNFKIFMSFTYNKYLRLGIRTQEAYWAIKVLLKDPTITECLTSVANTPKIAIRYRLLAKYVLCTGVKGYKFLNTLLRKR